MKLRYQIDRVEHTAALDPAVDAMTAVADRALPDGGPLRNLLHGTWLGHPVHPALTDVPIGLWTATTLLDLVGGGAARPAAQRLLGIGLLTAVPTATTGLADWSALGSARAEKRTGVAHAAANAVGMTILALSYAARRTGRHRIGAALGLAGMVVATAGAYLGGHLVFRQAVGIDRTADEPTEPGWQRVARVTDLEQGVPAHATAGDAAIVLVRTGQEVTALQATCSHMGGPLHQGDVVDRDGRACIRCPWHGSVFALADGSVVDGPATGPQVAYDTRAADGWVEVRARPLAAAEGSSVVDLSEVEPSTATRHA